MKKLSGEDRAFEGATNSLLTGALNDLKGMILERSIMSRAPMDKVHMAIKVDEGSGIVTLDFNGPVHALKMSAAQARQVGEMLQQVAVIAGAPTEPGA